MSIEQARPWWWAGAILAAATLVFMATFGTRPQSGQLIKFEAKGLLVVGPESIREVSLRDRDGEIRFQRNAIGIWSLVGAGQPVAEDLGKQLDLAVRIMHTSAPLREMSAAEYAGTMLADFGLDPPRLSVALSDGSSVVLGFDLGNQNPQDLLRYLRVHGRDSVYLMSGFIGTEWEKIVPPPAQR
ncbi:MAG: DUF4340 domain-containing protein [Burkholderiales bacterium]|nr:DUF4340 domain-containing protein [Burkholderiales bacterium]